MTDNAADSRGHRDDAFTNRELAENRTWPSAMAYVECPFCHFLSSSAGLSAVSTPCPNCGASGEPRVCFPDLSSQRLLEMIAHFYVRSCERQAEIENELLGSLNKESGRRFDWNAVAQAILALHRSRQAVGGMETPEGFEQLLATIQTSLGLQSTEDARKIFPSLFRYSDTTEEHQVVVLLAATMLEKLFQNLLMSMLNAASRSGGSEKPNMKKYSKREAREQLFAKLAGESLQVATATLGSAGFYTKWQAIRKLRNRFMHSSPFAIGANDTEEAFEVAKQSFGIFAELHNKFCV